MFRKRKKLKFNYTTLQNSQQGSVLANLRGTSVVIDTGVKPAKNGFHLTGTLFSRKAGRCRRNTWEMKVAPLLRPCAEHRVADNAPTAYRRGAVWTQVLKTGFVTLLKNSVPPPVWWPPSDGEGSCFVPLRRCLPRAAEHCLSNSTRSSCQAKIIAAHRSL